jgi:hypothetical protein
VPRLVRFLLALMFNDSPKPGGTTGARPEVSPPRRAAAPGPTIVSMDDKGRDRSSALVLGPSDNETEAALIASLCGNIR